MLKKIAAIAVVVLGLPVFLFIFQPSWQLGGIGLALGMLGMTVTPLVVLGSLLYTAYKLWTSGDKSDGVQM
ncbi:MAG TPA: hypothetical protein VJH91_01265 [Candidatus Paceibacterota bacterium]